MDFKPAALEGIRQSGWRPTVVLGILNGKKVLLTYRQDHQIWQLPQGGINPGEAPAESFLRELGEELGPTATKAFQIKPQEIAFLGYDQMEFSPKGKEKLMEKEGQPHLKGKVYFFFTAPAKEVPAKFTGSQFQEHRFVSYQEGKELAATIYQTGKRRITEKFLDLLKEKGGIS